MRITIKGGVWKNSEDEILKAAVMKYGKNQWARISSLIVRKSAKQCKARWYEWLDPAIKKTEWTRAEDEKLLHLAKLMPTQWRTIAPIVGRTPAQCLERYEKLLDAAARKEEGYDAADDPRRLRPGEIDPHPETKPARPDAVDMDEDEKEMLNEARARLANTRGKKAKRKAREKQMEEARRLALLQKKRELKAAGMESTQRRRQAGIDYNAEIAFEKQPAPGFYDTSAEREAEAVRAQEPFKAVTIEELEGRRRKQIEDALMKEDIARQQERLAKDAPGAIAAALALNDGDAGAPRKRSKLMLPAPQISERELEDIVRMGSAGEAAAAAAAAAAGSSGVTSGLLPDYAAAETPLSERVGRTPMRTPAGPGGDAVLLEAENLAKLQKGQTPLLGGANPDLHRSDFTGVTPRRTVAATPNPLAASATPLPAGSGATPRLPGPGTTPLPTPLRDGLGINSDADVAVAGETERVAKRQKLSGLRAALGALPAPKNEYQIVAPELEQDEPMADAPELEPDAADHDAAREAAVKAAAEAEWRRQTQAVQRGLPRPAVPLKAPADDPAADPLARAEGLVAAEIAALVAHDARAHPGPGAKGKAKSGGAAPALPRLDDALLERAREMLREEEETVKAEAGTEGADLAGVLKACRAELVWLPSQQRWARDSTLSEADRVEVEKARFEAYRAELAGSAKKALKLEQKVTLLCAGHMQRAKDLAAQISKSSEEEAEVRREIVALRMLHEQEQRAAPLRIEGIMAELAEVEAREEALQQRYALLSAEKAQLARDAAAAAASEGGQAPAQ